MYVQELELHMFVYILGSSSSNLPTLKRSRCTFESGETECGWISPAVENCKGFVMKRHRGKTESEDTGPSVDSHNSTTGIFLNLF